MNNNANMSPMPCGSAGGCGNQNFQNGMQYKTPGQQPVPAQALPLFLQQPPAQQSTGYNQTTMSQGTMQPVPSTQMQITPSLVRQSSVPTVQFTDYEQLAMLSENIPITAESLQFLNGFMRTQIGRRVKVEFLIGTNSFVDKEGTLLGVGVNYILINETDTDDLTACDFYNIKFIKFYY